MTNKKKYKILLVDDHAFIRMSMANVLVSEDIIDTVAEASSSQQAINLINTMKFDLVILDLSMPEQDGFVVIRKVKNTAHNCDARILIFSSFYEPSYVSRAMRFGAHGYVCKKEDISQLILATRAVLAGYNCFRIDVMAEVESIERETVSLTAQELDVARQLSNGLKNKEIGRRMNLSEKTVSSHKTNIMKKSGARNKAELLNFLKKINNEIF